MLSVDDALAQVLARAVPIEDADRVPTLAADGRVLAAAQHSALNVPPMDNVAMDGYAVRVEDVVRQRRLTVSQRVAAGEVAAPLAPGTVARVFTGAMLPPGADAVVMQEQTRVDGDTVEILEAPRIGDWIRNAGEDIAADSVILAKGARLTPQATGLAASVGIAELSVVRRVRVACFFTGNELVMPGEPLRDGAIYNSNRFVLVSLLRRLGCEITDLGIVPDSLEATRAALVSAAAGNDLIVTCGGMSVGEEDHVKPAVQAEGELELWQISMKPGKPLAYGQVRRAAGGQGGAAGATAGAAAGGFAHFIGLPGNPVSSFVTFLIFVRPFLLALQGVGDLAPRSRALRADFEWPKPDRRREFLRVRLNAGGGLDLFPNQSSAVLTSTVWGDGLVDNPGGRSIDRGDLVRFIPFSELLN
ncbi:MAG: molybdopterin molybdotransferase MoeA [Burkholderiales bacterium]|nr:MAG: molybdopterin molybdotransferase MoeA [Burkholderiales bacterium]